MAKQRFPAAYWSELQVFFAVAQNGSATAAAEALGLDHSTVSRRLKVLLDALGVPLLTQAGNSYALTPSGVILRDAIDEMAQTLDRALWSIGSTSISQEKVSISVSEGFVAQWLIPRLVPYALAHPSLEIAWLPSSRPDLRRQHADLVVKRLRPDGSDLVVTHLGRVRYRLFGTTTYARRHGLPATASDLTKHKTIHFRKNTFLPEMAPWNNLMRRFPPSITVETPAYAIDILRQHEHIALMAEPLQDIYTDIVAAPLDCGAYINLWLGYPHSDRQNARILGVAAEIERLAGLDPAIRQTSAD